MPPGASSYTTYTPDLSFTSLFLGEKTIFFLCNPPTFGFIFPKCATARIPRTAVIYEQDLGHSLSCGPKLFGLSVSAGLPPSLPVVRWRTNYSLWPCQCPWALGTNYLLSRQRGHLLQAQGKRIQPFFIVQTQSDDR